MKMSDGMKQVKDPHRTKTVMLHAAKRLKHVPYCGWRKNAGRKHIFGVLRMWPKWKVVRKVWKTRAEARRPENMNLEMEPKKSEDGTEVA